MRDPDVALNQLVNPDEPWRLPIVAPTASDESTAVTLADSSCPPGPASWQVATADMWGQWSAFGAGGGDPPALPPVPTPTVVFEFLTAAPAPGSGPASPRDVVVRVTVPPPPSPAPPITWVEANFWSGVPAGYGGLDDQGGGVWSGQMPVSPTTPGGWAYLNCTVTAADANNRRASVDATATMYDPRPFVAPLTSGVLLFSGGTPPGWLRGAGSAGSSASRHPAGRDVALLRDRGADPGSATGSRRAAMVARQPPACRHRRIADAGPHGPIDHRSHRALGRRAARAGPAAGPPRVGPSPAARGDGCDRARGAVGQLRLRRRRCPARRHAACGTDVLLTATLTYPGTRPAGDAPPWPIARRTGAAATSVRARIRRSASGRDPSMWPVIAVVDLAPNNPADPARGWRWTAVVTDALPASTPAWSPLSYVCEVAWPDEPAWNPVAAPVFGAVRATWSSAAAQPSVWSAASAAVALRGPRPIVAVLPTYVDNHDGTATITVAVPTAHPRAPQWTLTAMVDPIVGLPPVTVAGPGPTLALDVDGTFAPALWLLAVVTPAGTTLPIVAADGTTPP